MIESSIARGQGRSVSGAALEPLLVEIILPPAVAIVVEAETDNKRRTLEYLRIAIKDNGGLNSSSSFYFARRGRAVFKPKKGGPTLADLIDEAIEHEGLQDVEELADEEGFLVWTEVPMLSTITEALAKKFDLEIMESDLVWDPNEDTMTEIDSATVNILDKMLTGLREHPEVKGVYANIRQGAIPDGEWERIDKHLDF
jgi:transcriptional/translational regulatory protein YebC/TACO1